MIDLLKYSPKYSNKQKAGSLGGPGINIREQL